MNRKRLLLLGLMSLGGCAHYAPLPLPRAPSLATALPMQQVKGPLTLSDVAALVVDRNPDLIAARTKRGLAQAQLSAAGILPNPSLAGAFLPLISGAGTVPAWNVGITQDIKSLIVYRPKLRAARNAAAQVDADLLWQEWQTVGQARQLAADIILGERSLILLRQAAALLAHRNAVMQGALAARDVTLVTAAPSITAYQNARANLLTAEQNQLVLRHKLNALLGLTPEVMIPLADRLDVPAVDPVTIGPALAGLPQRRPDLVALRFGYAQADENLRVQILSQFPDLVFGGTVSSDSSKVINAGPQGTIGLPIFDRNQGNVAIARATRAQLHAEYVARLAAVTGEVGAMLREREALARQLDIVRRDLPWAKLAADRAAQAFGRSALDERSYVDLVTTYYSKEQERMTLETALADRDIAIDTLIGAGLPQVDNLPSADKVQP